MPFAVVCYAYLGFKPENTFSVYDTKAEAEKVAENNNTYEDINHPNDDVYYEVLELTPEQAQGISRNRKSLWPH